MGPRDQDKFLKKLLIDDPETGHMSTKMMLSSGGGGLDGVIDWIKCKYMSSPQFTKGYLGSKMTAS